MAKAEYSDRCQGHYGLGIEKYCHFTSPIRRLSDLATHRIIHKVIFEGKDKKRYSGYAKRAAAAATELGAHKLFISSIPSKETVAFYFAMGCTDAMQCIPAFVDSETDRWLELPLN